MLNEELKNEFIMECTEQNQVFDEHATRVFNKTAELEDMLEKDISNFTAKEIIAFYKQMFITSMNTMVSINSILTRYTRFMISRNMVEDNINHFEEITYDTLYSCLNIGKLNNEVITREDLMEIIDKRCVNPCDKFLLLAFFEGISGKAFSDFYDLVPENFQNGKVILKNREFQVPDLLKEYAKESASTFEYVSYKGEHNIRTFKADSDLILKPKFNAVSDADIRKRQRIYSQIAMLRNLFDDSPAIDAGALNESGRIDMVKSLMKEQNETSVSKTIKKNMDAINNKYGVFPGRTLARYLTKYEKYYL